MYLAVSHNVNVDWNVLAYEILRTFIYAHILHTYFKAIDKFSDKSCLFQKILSWKQL